MADPADPTGRDAETGVDTAANDAFASAFTAFASGDKPEPDAEAAGSDADAGYGDDDDDGELSPASNRSAAPQSAAPASAAAGQDPTDPWANAAPELRAARDKLVADYEAKVRGASGRASGLQRELNALKSASAAPPPRQEDGDNAGANALDDKIKQLREDYPEVAAPLIEMLEAQRDQIANLSSMMAPVINASEADHIALQARELEAVHPDWRDYAPQTNADFRGWMEAQTPAIQALAESFDAREVGVALTLFKTERAEAMRAGGDSGRPQTDARRQRQLDGGRDVGSRPASAASGAPDDFAAAFEHFAAKAK